MSNEGLQIRWWALNVAVPVAVLAVLGSYLWRRRELFEELDQVGLGSLALVAALTAIAHFLNATQFGLLYRGLGAKLGTVENWLLFSAGQFGNYLPGQLGTLYRLRYLKSVHGMAYAGATAAYGLNLVISILATGVTGLLGCLVLGARSGQWSLALIAILGGLIFAAVGAAVIPLPAARGTGRLARAWGGVSNGWHQLQQDRALGISVLALEVLRYTLTAWRLQLTFAWLGISEPYEVFLIIGPIGALVTFVGLTPAGLGLRELGVAAALAALGRSFDEGLAGSSTDRAVSLGVVAIVGTIGYLYTAAAMTRVRNSAAQDSAVPGD